ncbi:hypothetical protein DFH08DRAFT_875145 [Mycena albidolilacea]|uniref:C2H2-type domain-containing protein n=1 Tax=Mycena albidolilacea TaxID=1033008 RepID=A0AAD6ZVE6_9AGAR|nr:hypothetical protein DFH08DRAFT_875145 [Mycena albidolilacea]
MFSVTDPLGRPIPISLAHCGDFEALDRMLKACIFNRPEAGARYVERGDYNLFLPEGTIVRRVDFARTVKSGTQLDMSIIKRPRFPHTLDPEKCPYCNEENPKTTGNEWILCSNHQCGRRYQISVKLADKIEAIEEIYSPQLLTKGDETQTQEQDKEDTDLFRLVEIQATYPQVASPAGVHAANLRRKRPPKFQCEDCPATFTTKHNWKNHLNSHRGIRPHFCGWCGLTFTTPAVKKRHEKNQVCGKQSASAFEY